MNLLRNVLSDLVEKRLWPVAVALIAAVVAVPVVLGSGGAADYAAEPAPAAPADAVTASIVTPAEVATAKRARPGSVRDPFRQRGSSKQSDSISQGASSQTGNAGSTVTSGGGGGASAPATSSPAPEKQTSGPGLVEPKHQQAPDPEQVYRVSVRFGEPGEQRTRRDIARLTPLPSSNDPFFVFLGVTSGGKTAVFLVSSDASVSGDGKCRPSRDACETVELKAGETAFFDLSDGSAGIVQYQLDVLTVAKRTATSAAAAKTWRERESKAGRAVLRSGLEADRFEVGDWHFDEATGLLIAPKVSSSNASDELDAEEQAANDAAAGNG